MTTYIDTNIFSRLLDLKIPDQELDALSKLIQNENINFVTSYKTFEEFSNTTEHRRKKSLLILYRLVQKTEKYRLSHSEPALFGNVMWGEAVWGGGVERNEKEYESLLKIFDADDAEHIFQAIKNKCDYFLTLDSKTILIRFKKNKQEVSKIGDIKFGKPTELLSLLLNKDDM